MCGHFYIFFLLYVHFHSVFQNPCQHSMNSQCGFLYRKTILQYDQTELSPFILICLYLPLQSFSDNMGFLISIFCALGVFTLLFILVCIKSVLQKGMKLLAVIIWGCLVAMSYAFIFTSNIVTLWDQVNKIINMTAYSELCILLPVQIYFCSVFC